MYTLKDIKARSVSSCEMVVDYTDALELLYLYQQSETRVLGWEGWLRHENGALSHSIQHQGTVDLSNMPPSAASALVKSTIMQARQEFQTEPEIKNAELYFCITVAS